jgi:hypothetical protein
MSSLSRQLSAPRAVTPDAPLILTFQRCRSVGILLLCAHSLASLLRMFTMRPDGYL